MNHVTQFMHENEFAVARKKATYLRIPPQTFLFSKTEK